MMSSKVHNLVPTKGNLIGDDQELEEMGISDSDVELIHVENEIEEEKSDNEREGTITRNNASKVWRDFEVRDNAAGEPIVYCKHCNKSYKKQKCGTTSTYLKHLLVCKNLPKKRQQPKGQKALGFKKLKKFSIAEARVALAKKMIMDEDAFKLVESIAFNSFLQLICPSWIPITRNTIKTACLKVFKEEKQAMIERLKRIRMVCLTTDMWTSITSKGFMSLTIHYIDEDWKLQKRILAFRHVPPPHNQEVLANALYESMEEWKVEEKVFTVTVDNAAVNKKALERLTEKMKNKGVLFSGHQFHIRCCAHILNLVVSCGIEKNEEIRKVILYFRESVKFVKSSEARRIQFDKCCEPQKIELNLDVPTRWNSTFLMIESILKSEKAWGRLQDCDPNYKVLPEPVAWDVIKDVYMLLQPFYVATCSFSGNKYPTSNMFISETLAIKRRLVGLQKAFDREKLDNDLFGTPLSKRCSLLDPMVTAMLQKYNDYWSTTSTTMTLGTVLDPRHKWCLIEFSFDCLYDVNGTLQLESRDLDDPPETEAEKNKERTREEILQLNFKRMRAKLDKIFNFYLLQYSPKPSSQSGAGIGANDMSSSYSSSLRYEVGFGVCEDTASEYAKFRSTKRTANTSKTEFDLYLEESPLTLSIEEAQKFDVMAWWKKMENTYPILSKMAKDVLAVPISTVASESAFSTGGRVLNQYRSRLLPSTVESLVCTQDWLRPKFNNASIPHSTREPVVEGEDEGIW